MWLRQPVTISTVPSPVYKLAGVISDSIYNRFQMTLFSSHLLFADSTVSSDPEELKKSCFGDLWDGDPVLMTLAEMHWDVQVIMRWPAANNSLLSFQETCAIDQELFVKTLLYSKKLCILSQNICIHSQKYRVPSRNFAFARKSTEMFYIILFPSQALCKQMQSCSERTQ